jgi:hypothetical protein
LARWPCGGFASPARRPKPRGPGAPQRVTGLAHRGVRSAMRGRRGQLLQRWIDAGRPRGTPDGIRNVSHRGSRGASLQTPRAERRGTGISVMKTACALKLIFVHRVTGCSAPRRSARPRTFSSTGEAKFDDGVPRAGQPIGAAQRWLSQVSTKPIHIRHSVRPRESGDPGAQGPPFVPVALVSRLRGNERRLRPRRHTMGRLNIFT